MISPSTGNVPALICYFKRVQNNSTTEVRDVRWEVADFFRQIIPKQQATSACPQIPGDLKAAPTSDPTPAVDHLSSGLRGRLAYDDGATTKGRMGWRRLSGNRLPRGTLTSEKNSARTRTVLAFFVTNREGVPVPARLVLESEKKSEGDQQSISYSVRNDSATPLYAQVNLSATKSILGVVPLLSDPLFLDPKATKTFTAKVEERPTIDQATIVVLDVQKQIAVIDSGAFYTVRGFKLHPDRSFWESVK